MGTDIHSALEYKENGTWRASLRPNKWYGKYEFDEKDKMSAQLNLGRDYDLFAVLANVRNGYGFAGSPTGSGFHPMSDHRGLPTDISSLAREACDGDHSDSWVSLHEVLAYDWTRTTVKTGVVSAREFESWERMKGFKSVPDSYCGGISGARIKMISEADMQRYVSETVADKRGQEWTAAINSLDENIYTQIEWSESYARATESFWIDPLPTMLKLGAQYSYENVRMVMNFDS